MAFRLFHIHVTSYSIDASEDSSPQTSCLKKFKRKNIGHRLCEKIREFIPACLDQSQTKHQCTCMVIY